MVNNEAAVGLHERAIVPDIQLAGALQATLLDVPNRPFDLDIQQEEALGALGEALLDGRRTGYIEMATSTGKTAVEALLTEAAVRAGKRVLLLAPTLTICRQLIGLDGESGLGKFARLGDDARVTHHTGSPTSIRANVVVSTYSGFLQDYQGGHAKMGEFDVIIADECHRSLGAKTSEALKQCFPDAFKVGLSATPDYALDRQSDEIYQTCLYEFSLQRAIESGKTAPIRALVYETEETVRLSDPGRDFTEKELEPLVRNVERNGTALSLVEAFVADGRRGIIACIPGQQNLHARLLVGLLKQRGIRATELGSHLNPDEQRQRLRLYRQGVYDVLTFTRSLEEGWDSDQASFAINMAPTTSPVRTKQLMGRVLRRKPEGQDSIYVDFVDKKTGLGKAQYTALHALGLEETDFTRVLGHNQGGQNQFSRVLKLLRVIDPKLLEKLQRSQGKLIRDIAVQPTEDPLVREWRKRLEAEGLPEELPSHPVLSPRLGALARRQYDAYWRDNGVPPNAEELLDLMGIKAEKQRRLLGEYLIRIDYDKPLRKQLAKQSANGSEDPVLEQVVNSMLHEDITKILDTFSERTAGVITMRLGLDGTEPATLDEIGKHHGISHERVRQIYIKGIEKFQHPKYTSQLMHYWKDDSDQTHGMDRSRDSQSHISGATTLKFINSILETAYRKGLYRNQYTMMDKSDLSTVLQQVFGTTRLTQSQLRKIDTALAMVAKHERDRPVDYRKKRYDRLYESVREMIKEGSSK
ncbi:DEAD/DEAH box helicase family protein [Candidatus Saccharibacteria bacterium]|nr:DEAD/DEAH box helicase family protein [Candidatus Saccharibacteria bacterium]